KCITVFEFLTRCVVLLSPVFHACLPRMQIGHTYFFCQFSFGEFPLRVYIDRLRERFNFPAFWDFRTQLFTKYHLTARRPEWLSILIRKFKIDEPVSED